jgi:hypothetical protein
MHKTLQLDIVLVLQLDIVLVYALLKLGGHGGRVCAGVSKANVDDTRSSLVAFVVCCLATIV